MNALPVSRPHQQTRSQQRQHRSLASSNRPQLGQWCSAIHHLKLFTRSENRQPYARVGKQHTVPGFVSLPFCFRHNRVVLFPATHIGVASSRNRTQALERCLAQLGVGK